MKKLLAVINAFVGAFRLTFARKTLYKKLLAYGCTIGGMKYDGNSKDVPPDKWKPNDCWPDELPSMLYLDKITDKMNAQNDNINEAFKLNVELWNRDEVRILMDMFKKLHDGYCNVNGKNLSLVVTCAMLSHSMGMTFWQRFILLLTLTKP